MRRAKTRSTRRLGDRLVAALCENDAERRGTFVRDLCEPEMLIVSDGRTSTGLGGLHAAASEFRTYCAGELLVPQTPSMIRGLIRFEWRLHDSDRAGTLLVSQRRARIDAIYLTTR
ncbi:MAG: hypothetical protein Q7T68_12440 [Sphingopyxis sp.]|nr:hypothetical protein [Sphingopyxis sp.]